MKVLHIYRTYFPETQGGLQEAIRQIACGLSRAGATSSVFTLAKKPRPDVLRIDDAEVFRARSVVDVSSCDIGSPLSVLWFRRLAARADILNFHYPWPFGDVLELLGNPGKPYVITYHSDIVRQRVAEAIYAPLRSHFVAGASSIITTSPAYARTSEYLSRTGRSVDVIPLSIDPSDIKPASDEVAQIWQRRFPEPFFFFVGVLRYYKGLEYLIEAARITGFNVVIAGDGPERDRLRYLAAGLGNVHFLGRVSDEDKFALIQQCRAVVFPSHLRAEAFGVSLLEGAALGKAMISTEIGTGTSYVNVHAETGLVVPPANPEAFAVAMQNLIDNPEVAAQYGKAARERCVQKFDTTQVGRAYMKLYERVLVSQAFPK
ncbi:glycosyltransferase [Uliginosibacterium sp. 31-12]|uniref:glycosyltransferase n=1 Tax=Uliginosibacterium sp. 31-12 TaxID=3062781 RepID=UPI0026E34163|nr:glycosyltransferase [Uliginosibacterium sp. 31-12]MDO6388163.1 glycosyltransferase [Uliginosibacterium sp. 31-12]